MNLKNFIFLLVLKVTFLIGQTPSFFNYTTEDGLLTNTIYCVHQDSKGYMWFGTDRGISRFNGKTFTNFNIPNEKLPDIYSIFEDKNKKLWFVGGTSIWHIVQNKIIPYKYNDVLFKTLSTSSSSQAIRRLYIDNKKIFHITANSFQQIKIDSNGLLSVSNSKKNKVYKIDSLWFFRYSTKRIATNNGKKIIDIEFNSRKDTIYNVSPLSYQ